MILPPKSWSGSPLSSPELFLAALPTPGCWGRVWGGSHLQGQHFSWSLTGSGEVMVSHGGAKGGFCSSLLALPCSGVSCFSYIVAWESCVTVKRVTISLSELLPSRCRVLESSQQTSTADTLPTCSFSHPSTCTYLNNQRT